MPFGIFIWQITCYKISIIFLSNTEYLINLFVLLNEIFWNQNTSKMNKHTLWHLTGNSGAYKFPIIMALKPFYTEFTAVLRLYWHKYFNDQPVH